MFTLGPGELTVIKFFVGFFTGAGITALIMHARYAEKERSESRLRWGRKRDE